jgi:uncharacterized membrane protein
MAIGGAIGLLLPAHWNLVTRALVGWNVAVWTYLVLMAWLIARCSHREMNRLATQEDNNAVTVLVVMSLGAIVSLVAIVAELSSARAVLGGERLFHYTLTGCTVIGSWLLLATIYMFHYAHLYCRAADDNKPLRFPDEDTQPVYSDFLYFSFTIAVAAQTSDVVILSTSMRKAVLAQSVLSFFFNAAIIGMSINIAASLIGT